MASDPFSFSDILSPKFTPQTTIPITTSIPITTTTSIEQGGLFNLKGQLGVDLSTDNTKKALIYAPIYQIGSPSGKISSNPSTPQTSESLLPILIVGAGILLLGVLK